MPNGLFVTDIDILERCFDRRLTDTHHMLLTIAGLGCQSTMQGLAFVRLSPLVFHTKRLCRENLGMFTHRKDDDLISLCNTDAQRTL